MKNSRNMLKVAATFFQRCWIVGAVVAIVALVSLADEPAWAGPLQQFTVPTATPQPIGQPEEELIPTATPQPLFEPEDNNGSNEEFNQPEEEPTAEPFFPTDEPDAPLFDEPVSEEPVFDEPAVEQPDNFFEDSTSSDPSDDSNVDDSTFEDPLPDPSFDPLADETSLDDSTSTGFSDDFSTSDAEAGSAGGAFNDGAAAGGAVDSTAGADTNEFANDDSTNSLFGNTNSGVVSISVLNLRRNPAPDADIIDTMWRNDVVEISQTARGGTWLLVCCGVEEGSAGWVSSLFINHDANNLTVGSLDSSTATAATTEAVIEETVVEEAVAEITADTRLELTMIVTDTTIQAGQFLDIAYAIENIGSVDATNVQLGNELPKNLYFINYDLGDTGQLTRTVNAQNNQPILTMAWPEVEAAQTVTATLTVQIATDAPNGLVIDNLAGVGAENAEGDTAAVSLGTPPGAPPSFRRR